MPRRPAPEALSPRALARLRSRPRSYVPTEFDLDLEPRSTRVQRSRDAVPGRDLDLEPRSTTVDSGSDAVTGGGLDLEPRSPTVQRSPDAVRGGALDASPPVGGGFRSRVRGRSHHEHGGRSSPAGASPPRPGGGGRHIRATHPRRWARLPAAFVGARWQPGRGAVVGVVVVAALAVAVFGLRVAWARSASDGTVLAPGGGARAGPTGVRAGAVPVGVPSPSASASAWGAADGAGAGGGTPTAAGGATASAVVVVHVVGQVRHPGVRRLPVGSRVADAVAAAGGATRTADLGLLNLARALVDGEQVRVPAPGDPAAVAPVLPGGGGGAGVSPGSPAGPVSLNTADLAALDTLPGVGPVLAQRILDWRATHGRFASVDELGEVSGIGDKLLAQLSPLVTL